MLKVLLFAARPWGRGLLAAGLALAVAGLPAAPASRAAPNAGPVYAVDRIDDVLVLACTAAPNDCSLRGAITAANANPGATIHLDSGSVYTLSEAGQGDLQATADMTIYPAGPCGFLCFTVIQGGAGWNDRLLHVTVSASVVVSGVLWTGGNGSNGGAFFNEGTLNVHDSLVFDNTANGYGGGLFNLGGQLNLVNTIVSSNQAEITGGGLANQGGTMTIAGSSIHSNATTGVDPGEGGGGGITNFNSVDQLTPGLLFITNTEVLTNTTSITLARGGGLYNYGQATLVDSTVRANSAQYGGGIVNNAGQMTITASLILSNTAEGGGGIRSDAPLFMDGVTVQGNLATGGGAGGLMSNSDLRLANSSVYANTGFQGGGIETGAVAARVWLTNTAVTYNTASYGGGLAGYGTFTLTTNSQVNHNMAYQGGGAKLFSTGRLVALAGTQLNDNVTSGGASGSAVGAGIDNAGTVVLNGAELAGNQALNGSGGGLFNAAGATADLSGARVILNSASHDGGGLANAGTLVITASAVVSNTAVGYGGSLTNTSTLTLLNTTLSGNQAGWGAGLWNTGTATARFTTVAANDSVSGSGGLVNLGTFTLGSSVIDDNPGFGECEGVIGSAGFNLVGDTDGCDFDNNFTDQIDLDALLLPLAEVGGTWVHALDDLSPAIDTADPAGCPAQDQTGAPRPSGSACDVGAFELPGLSVYRLFLPLVVR